MATTKLNTRDTQGHFDLDASTEPLLTGVNVLKTGQDSLQYLLSGMKWLKSNTFPIIGINSLSNNYLGRWDDTNGKFINSLIYDNGTNVGIGVTSPLYYKLQVKGILGIQTTSGINDTRAIVYADDDGAYYTMDGSVTKPIIFKTWTSGAETMRISTSGNVGIGTIDPSYKLDISGNVRLKGVGSTLFFDTTGVGGSAFIKTTNDYWLTLKTSRGLSSQIDLADGSLIFSTNNSERIRVLDNGKVGIGTPNPTEKLDVNGYIKALSGFKKGSLDDTRMLLAGGGDKLLSDFSLSGHLHTGVYLGINDTAAISYNSYALDGYSLSDFPLLDNGKIQAIHLPDYLLGQVLFGGTIDINLDCTITLNCQNKYGLPSIENIGGLNAPDYEGVYFIATDNITVGTIAFEVGDWVISNGISWIKIDNTDAVSSVNGRNGAVVITLASLNGQPLDSDLTAIAALTGTSGFLRKTAADTWALVTDTFLKAGTGLVTNRVLKYVTGGTLENTVIQESGGFVGIDIAPDNGYKLGVGGHVNATGNLYGQQIISNVSAGYQPYSTNSQVLCTNLNADLLDGQHGSYYAVKTSRTLKITANSTTFIPLTSEKDNDITIDNNVLENTKFEFQAIHVEDSDLGDGEWESVREYTLRVKFVTKPSGLDFTFITDGPFTQFYKSLSNFTELENINADEIVIYTVKYVEGFGWLLSNEIFRPV